MLQPISSPNTQWSKILTKGLITLPKPWRDDLGLKEGQLAKVKKVGRSIVIEPTDQPDYELYSDAEIQTMLLADALPPKLAAKAKFYWKDIK
ncbi:MAG: hypothetical protein UX80_C0019G0014 [Candidatus Amesbacteria bacterium GW2011_GWA2_47_11b]|uniref:SpoVT-AbrB domain-containing protein n=3 Tax=Candidatus Amesiibacteriota TaxID=1752730 RepID=A0A0G1SEL2_9BACT|nr:MAG: hypothetical protein UX42_C0003G0081 [Microgenomates group bacterium GW2011_GWC1_46_20]KKU57322.1 MAG: hypothetical protein UX80_C0019G0014 [Candidatus Amesbacteria bacterium GW2011_GWA2_47_11b]KKU67872.1 MAG: hypothetical protein UX92_C0028G0004 [Candidatus Amesbacteria bacterium GW2011_GWA1_47_20]KKU83432.1 MAG: hypothetical protein UY11_C0020G0014 [Candidatus Amesbacteria bacterium GW2011_GWC2_47_8]